MVRVKICGITNMEDAIAAVDAGADALGFVFAHSPRRTNVKTARDIISAIPPFVVTVGVFAEQKCHEIAEIMESAKLCLAQIHGNIELGEEFSWRTIRAIRIRSEEDIKCAASDSLTAFSSAVLLDAHVEGILGGTGQTFDWSLGVQAQVLRKPIILAGGLTPDNVAEAIQIVRPYGVDVSSGVETSPGKKNHARIKEFIENAEKAI